MTKDSGRLSVAGFVPTTHQNIEDEPTHNGSSKLIVNGSRDTATGESTGELEKEELTPSASISGTDPARDGHGSVFGTAPYGTRSRNRVGVARPNYAEDKELETDFDVPGVNDSTGRRASRLQEAPNVLQDNRQNQNNRKISSNETESSTSTHAHIRESLPGTSSFSANSPAQPALKKRKITAQSTGSVTSQSASTSAGMAGESGIHSKMSSAAQLVPGFRETNMLGFESCGGQLQNHKLVADDGTILEVNDHVYLVCEPPGEPYYLGRIMEFLHANNDPEAPIDALRLNWYYRPKDIGRIVNDTRQVFASMHSDISPLTALRGKCQIKHKSEVDKLDDVRRAKDTFWYEKLYDRYIHRFYDVVPTSQVINVPDEVKRVLDERWRYIVVEPGRGKELTSAVKSCKRCSKYCASNDSVDCAVCGNTYHMSCVSPPLLKKPSRGFAWACGPCSKAQEKKLEARNTPNATEQSQEGDDDVNEEDIDSPEAQTTSIESARLSPALSAESHLSPHPGTAEQIYQASLWLFRYLGIHCKVEDALDYDDRIYPRASSRLGPRHQAIVPPWYGQPVEYVKSETRRKYAKGGTKKDPKVPKETVAAIEADKAARESRPKWIMDEPVGFVQRGEDFDNDDERNTAKLLYKHPEDSASDADMVSRDQLVFGYMTRAASLAQPLALPSLSTNLLDVALETLYSLDFDSEKALQALVDMNKRVFKEPELTATELKKFEDGVSKYGSEWHSIKKHVKTLKAKDVVRFYYTWKKTSRGKQVWGNYSGRRNKKEAKRAEVTGGKLQDDVADEHDDSAFDNDKAFEKRRGFQCKFCSTRSSRQWRRAPNTPAGTMISETSGLKTTIKDKGPQLMVALCRRCAELWRRYAIQWEDVDDVSKKATQAGGRTWKRKIDEELLNELVAANEVANHPPGTSFTPASAGGTPIPPTNGQPPQEAMKKKGKVVADTAEADHLPESVASRKKIVQEKSLPTPVPELPKQKTLPCAICGELESAMNQLLACRDCRMSVHRNCYGVMSSDSRALGKWVCDMCSNDKNPQVSVQYKCMLCPVEYTEYDFIEPVRNSNKKRSEKDRERERVERENNVKAAEFYRKRQEETNRPVNPREPLKRTANNNWVHVTCAVFTPEVKFGNAKALEPSEGIPSIPTGRYDETCKVCRQRGGACVTCHSCKTAVHVECAHQAGYLLGFDIVPVKSSRRDQVNVVNINGEIGTMTAAIWCKDHIPTKTIVHQMFDAVDENGLNALQLYVQTFKQADLTLTGTVRKATLVNQSTKAASTTTSSSAPNRRISSANANNNHGVRLFTRAEELPKLSNNSDHNERCCATCGVQISPRWWSLPPSVAQITSIESKDDRILQEHSQASSMTRQGTADTVVEVHAALAAAALHRDRPPSVSDPKEFQCHKCHWRKIKKESTTLPAPTASTGFSTNLQDIQIQGISTVPTNTMDRSDRGHTHPGAHYTWPQPATFPTNGLYPLRGVSPPSQGCSNTMLTNGHSPTHVHLSQPSEASHMSHSHAPPTSMVNGQSHIRASVPLPVSLSPRQNGHLSHGLNGFSTSPHRFGPSPSFSNERYSSYGNVRPPAQHLSNGTPSPRNPDHSLLADRPAFSHSRAHSFGSHPTSPSRAQQTYLQGRELSPVARATAHSQIRPLQTDPSTNTMPRIASAFVPGATTTMPVDSRTQIRELNSPQLLERPSDSRVNGGASASPSVRNLLS